MKLGQYSTSLSHNYPASMALCSAYLRSRERELIWTSVSHRRHAAAVPRPQPAARRRAPLAFLCCRSAANCKLPPPSLCSLSFHSRTLICLHFSQACALFKSRQPFSSPLPQVLCAQHQILVGILDARPSRSLKLVRAGRGRGRGGGGHLIDESITSVSAWLGKKGFTQLQKSAARPQMYSAV